MAGRIIATSFFTALAMLAPVNGHAQSRQPAAQEVTAIRDCATKYRDDLDAGERECLFKLVAEPCIGAPGSLAEAATAACYDVEGAIWDKLLNENYTALLGELDDQQAGRARAMQRAWIAYRDATCQFYDAKIRGSMSIMMHAACVARQTARQAMLLAFFSRL
jgi:uncharacterized protein YecT (DUF1311 family)